MQIFKFLRQQVNRVVTSETRKINDNKIFQI